MAQRGASAGKGRRNPGRRTRTVRKGGNDRLALTVYTGDTSSAVGPDSLSPGTEGLRSATPSPLSVFDPTSMVARITPKAMEELPSALKLLDKAYQCDEADDETLRQFLHRSGEPMYLLMAARHNAAPMPDRCPATLDATRRRCWRCPWALDDDLPF